MTADPLLDLARAALAQHDVSAGAEVRLLDISENATFRVDDGGAATVLRLHRTGYHDRAAVESELDWTGALRREGVVQTPAVLPARDGSRVVLVAPTDGGPQRMAVRFEHAPGAPPEDGEDQAGQFEALGELTARLHHHASRWRRPDRFTRFSWDTSTLSGPQPRWGRWQDAPGIGRAEHEVLDRLASHVGSRLDTFGRGPERWGLIHADLRPANLLVDPTAGVHVIDFDDCGLGWHLYDLATAVSFFEHEPHVPELLDRWFTGYRRCRPLSGVDQLEAWTLLMLRRLLLLAWIGSHQDLAFARDQARTFARDSCALAERYLSQHR